MLHGEFKGSLSNELSSASPPSPLLAQKQSTRDLLTSLFSPIASDQLQGTPPPLQAAAARFAGCYGKWLSVEQPSMVEGVVQFVLQATLPDPSPLGDRSPYINLAMCRR